jgi:hypothetical protein
MFHKWGEFIDHPSDYQLLKKDWSMYLVGFLATKGMKWTFVTKDRDQY